MSHHLIHQLLGKTSASTSRTSTYSAAKQEPCSSSMSVTPFFGPIPAAGFHPEGMYELKVDLNGDAVEELTCRITFNERDKQGTQTYTVRRLTGADAVNPKAGGTVIAQRTTDEILGTATGLRVWAGKAVTRSGSSPTCRTRSATHFRTARP